MQVVGGIMAIAAIALIQPRSSFSLPDFEVGRPWTDEQIIATFEFPVLKDSKQLQFELDSFRREFKPYFGLQPSVEREQVEAFNNAFRSMEPGDIPTAYRRSIEQRLHTLYQEGIVSAEELRRLRDDSCQAIFVVQGSVATTRRVNKLYNPRTAYEFLVSSIDSTGLLRPKLQRLNLNQFVQVNLLYDEVKSNAQWNSVNKQITPYSDLVYVGQSIIDRGHVVTPQDSLVLMSYKAAMNNKYEENQKDNRYVVSGRLLYVGIIITCLLLFFNLFRRDYITRPRSILFISVFILTFALITPFMAHHSTLSVYIIPYAMLPVFVRVFMDSRTAFFTFICTILLCAISVQSPLEFIATEMMSGLVAIYSLRDLSERSQIFRTALFSTLSAIAVYVSFALIVGNITSSTQWDIFDQTAYRNLFLSGILLLFAYPLMYLFERPFGFISNVTLVELSNVNRPLLRRLSEVAPGTFQHSVMVSNLAAEIANNIGAKAQLVRTGALYHDIGKMENPEYFTENQLGGVNPHSLLSNRESATIILRHVNDGLELADRYELPRIIKEFIATHHGRGMAKYFYITEQNAHPETTINPADFTYAGPNPSTSEQAILMMCDAVEASARSLKEYTEENIAQLVDRIIDSQVTEGYFNRCPITFMDIQTAKDVLKERLKTIYHTRVSYPTLTIPTAEIAAPHVGSHS